jgi:Replication initiator protein A
MAQTKISTSPVQGKSTTPFEKFYIENTLLRICGALFCHDPKQAASRTNEIELNRGLTEKHIIIRPDPKLGQPGQLAHKIFVALIKKHSDYGRPIRKEISFTRREIGRLIGRKEWGGQDSEQLSRALHEIHYTFITTHFKKQDGRYAEHSFNVFPEILLERREFASDPIEACTVTLAEPIVSSLQDEHFTCLNHAMMMRLGTIGQALMMRLFFHFANHYDGHNARQLKFKKRYDDICVEWLGGLTVLKYRSKIVGEQLGQHLDQLISEGFLASYGITKAKSRDGFVVTFRPGEAFFRDYDRFYRQRRQGDLQFEFHADQREIGELLRVAYLFTEKRTGQPVSSVAFVPSKDVETAKYFLTELTFAEMSAFIGYALGEASRTHFAVQTLGGIKQYLAGYLALKQRRAADSVRIAAREAQQRSEAERQAYDRDRRQDAFRLFETLQAEEQASIDRLARDRAATFDGTLRDKMLDFNRVRFTIERHGDKLRTFEQWKIDRLAA